MDFIVFRDAVNARFAKMSKGNLFRTSASKDDLWELYLNSFPEGSNPMFRERTEHDCNCCKQFIRTVGNVVAVVDNKLVSVWDILIGSQPEYQMVANAMAKFVKSHKIENAFLHYEKIAGKERTFEEIVDGVKTWEHFFVNIPSNKSNGKNFVVAKDKIGTMLSETRSTFDVFYRGLNEINMESVDTILDLIAQGSIYRGEEFKGVITAFKEQKVKFNQLTEKEQYNFAWEQSMNIGHGVSRIRNAAIGTLLTDLSEDMELERAVTSFETKLNPVNYRRPTALITKKMVEQAQQTIEELGLTSALNRRHAKLSDISVNDILYVDRNVKPKLSDNVFDEIANESKISKKEKTMKNVEEVPIDKFISDILPNVSSIELFMDNEHIKNLVSVIAPEDATAGQLFNWNNNFSWAYNGNITDSIKEKVKNAGGNISGDICCRLAWSNYDDLDLHMIEPDKNHIHYGQNRDYPSRCGGQLDVDMNAGRGKTRTPVENIFYRTTNTMKEGVYHLFVNQFSKRENTDIGFTVEFDVMGKVKTYHYPKSLSTGQNVTVVKFSYSANNGITIIEELPNAKTVAKEIEAWNIKTQQFHKVNVMMFSPNFWENSGSNTGNKHYFFILDNCKNDEDARGFFNEFLKGDLNKHRKVLEIVGSKMKVPVVNEQLSGLGFSSTNHTSILCKVKGNFTRTIKIVF